MAQLTKNFSLQEMIFSEKAMRAGLQNAPDALQLANLEFLARRMEEVRSLLGAPLKVNSAFRSQKVNTAVGGAKNSEHMAGTACDFIPIGMTCYEAAKKIEASDLKYNQLILEYGWIHIGFGGDKRESLTKRAASIPYEKGLKNYGF